MAGSTNSATEHRGNENRRAAAQSSRKTDETGEM
jgi:hypothetical protein